MSMRRRGVPSRRAHTSLGLATEVGSDGEDPAAESIFAPPATSSLPYIKTYSRQNERSALSQKVKQGVLDATQYHIYAENYGGVEFYRRMARKAESAMQLEQKQYHSELERSNELISRLRARVSALEVLSDEREVLLENQKRKVRQYKHQLQYNSKAYEKDMAYMRAQVEISEKRLAAFTEESKRKILDLRHDNVRKESALDVLQNDMTEILKSIDEPLDTFYLPDYFTQRIDSRSSPVRKTEGIKTAAKILRIRVDLDDLLKDTKSREKEFTSLQEEAKSLRKGAEESFKFRDSALNALKALEEVSHKLNGLDRTLASATLLKGVDLSALSGEKSQDEIAAGFNKVQEMIQLLVSKADTAGKLSSSLQYEHEKCGSVTAQLREDLGLERADPKVDVLSANLVVIREQVRRRLESLQMLQKEKSSVEVAVTKNASKARELERTLDDLTNKQRRLKLEKDKLGDALLHVEKEKAAVGKQLHQLQDLFVKLSSSLQDGSYGTLLRTAGAAVTKTSGFDEQKEVGSIVGCFEALVTEKTRLESKLKKGHGHLLELLAIFQKTEKGTDAVAELPIIIAKVVQLKMDSETASSKLKAAESELNAMGQKKDSQLDSTLKQVSDACGALQTSILKLQPIFGEVGSAKAAKGVAELGQVAAALSTLVPKVLDLKKERDSMATKLDGMTKERDSMVTKLDGMSKERDTVAAKLDGMSKERDSILTKLDGMVKERDAVVAKLDGMAKERDSMVAKLDGIANKLAEAEKRGSDDKGLSQSTGKHLDTIRQNLKAIQSLFPAELGKSFGGSLSDDIALLDKIKQELLSSKDTKDKALVRAQSLSVQASQLDPLLTELCAALQSIEHDLGGTPFKEAGSNHDTCGRLIFIKDRSIELKASVGEKVKAMSGEIGDLRERFKLQESVLKNSEKKWSERVELAKKEILRLGGCDLDNKVEASKRLQAQAKIKEFLLRAKQNDATINPLSKLATFQVELLVNNKAHGQLQVGGTMGGLFQAAVHYFKIESQSGEVTFENAAIPGSQSSNMLVELVLNSTGNAAVYESKAGDVLGLSVKVKSIDDADFREILYNSNVIQTDEVMDAIKGQTLDNFSLWPDLMDAYNYQVAFSLEKHFPRVKRASTDARHCKQAYLRQEPNNQDLISSNARAAFLPLARA
ncbi:autophagy-related protein 23 [Selaginella moellendorffii]|uniref:autophagy-related protein 23 n=1 Tax=Selaginella moellendorffii TaxID=88036 RepID=UPI000D1C710F|nr:autophagy-related protein 23 [Selaginella moellendorffii]|eukprot:XP_024534501.1 autophagy-related protein 23 [Selaginella moellendorffii]